MPTKSGALSSLPRKAEPPLNLSPGPTTSPLCLSRQEGSLGNHTEGRPIIYSIRTLQISTDIPAIYGWMRKQYAGTLVDRKTPPAELRMSYAAMLESDFAQPYIGFANELPICQLDLYQVKMDAISLSYVSEKNDHGLNIIMAPLVIQDQVVMVLRMWLQYFFSFPEIGRLVIDIEAGDDWQEMLFKRVGFRFQQQIRLPYKKANLYVCSSDSFFNAPY